MNNCGSFNVRLEVRLLMNLTTEGRNGRASRRQYRVDLAFAVSWMLMLCDHWFASESL